MSYIYFALIGTIPSFAWMFFFLREEIHPEPKKMIAKTFIAGALVTVLVVVVQYFGKYMLERYFIAEYSVISFLIFGVIEEVFKFLAAYVIIRKSKYFDEPMDAMIYMIVAALGFAMTENIAIMLNVSAIHEAFNVITLRFVGATLLHALSSGVLGFYWAKGLVFSRMGKINNKTVWFFILFGIGAASVLHLAFNYLILKYNTSFIYPVIFLIIAALFVFWDFENIKISEQEMEK